MRRNRTGWASLALILTTAFSFSACRGNVEADKGASDLNFLEKTSTTTKQAGDPCSLPGARARSETSSRTVSVVDRSHRKIDGAAENFRVRKLRFSLHSIEPENYSGPDESSPLPGQPPLSSLPFKGKYDILLAPVLPGFKAQVRPETRIIVVSSDGKTADVRRTLIRIMEETPIGQGTVRYFTHAFLQDEESTTVPIADLVGGTDKEKSRVTLKSDQLDGLLGQSSRDRPGGPTEGVMLELEPPVDGLQVDADKLLLWFEGKSGAFNVSGDLVCERQ